MTDVQTVSIVVAAVGVLIAAINSIFSSRRAEEQRQLTLETQQHALETRQAQLFMQIYNRWSSQEMVTAYEQLRVEYTDIDAMTQDILAGKLEPHREHYALHGMFLFFLEGLGILVKQKLINVEMVEDLFSQRIMWFWETRCAPYVDYVRETIGDPKMYVNIEYLYHEMKHRQRITARPQVN